MSVHQGKTIPTKAADEMIQIEPKNIPNEQIVSFPKPTEMCLRDNTETNAVQKPNLLNFLKVEIKEELDDPDII